MTVTIPLWLVISLATFVLFLAAGVRRFVILNSLGVISIRTALRTVWVLPVCSASLVRDGALCFWKWARRKAVRR